MEKYYLIKKELKEQKKKAEKYTLAEFEEMKADIKRKIENVSKTDLTYAYKTTP